MADRIDVMISSTALDLPKHREQAIKAILRMGMHPIGMENLSAKSEDAIDTSLAMVDEAEIYVGIFAHRYGTILESPTKNPNRLSVTELEYRRAVERDIPRLIFVIDETVPVSGVDMEKNPEGASKLLNLKNELLKNYVAMFFKSADELREQVIASLATYRPQSEPAAQIHYVSDIPQPPEVYIAHPYTLLQTSQLYGRQNEINLMTDWVAKSDSAVYQARILNFVAIGGMGKSAVTWKWFNDIAPHEMKPLVGRLWWSFYESDAHFENFIIRALAYVSKRAREDIEKNTKPGQREDMLLQILNAEPYLLVLDGLERILIAYARMDAAHLSDDDYDKQTANYVAGAYGLPESAAQSFVGEFRLRKTADPRAGNFLRKLAQVKASRILVSTRLYPADLQMVTGNPIAGSSAIFLRGLADDDALELWRGMGVSGSRDALLPMFQTFENYPLLIRALAGEVARYRRAPGDFDAWRKANPQFDPFKQLSVMQTKTHVLEYALRELNPIAKQALHTIAAFRAPADYETLVALLVGDSLKPCPNEQALDAVLTELEDRGLIGWDTRANRYDLHPVVRGVVWSALDGTSKQGVYTTLHAHFEAIPDKFADDYTRVESLDDLTPAIELYNTLVGLERYDAAEIFFYERLGNVTLYRLSASRQRIELLEMLFPDGVDQLPRLNMDNDKARTLNALALTYQVDGQPGRAVAPFKLAVKLSGTINNQGNVSVGLGNLSIALHLSGTLREAEISVLRALVIDREQESQFDEACSLFVLGLTLAARGVAVNHASPLQDDAEIALRRSLRMFIAQNGIQSEGVVNAYLAQAALWRNDAAATRLLASRAWDLAHNARYETDFIEAARLQGAAALSLSDFETADERLYHALNRARAVNYVQEELPALVALAELARRRGEPDKARELLNDVWEAAERGPYPLFHADALNVLAQIEHDAGNTQAAIKAAIEAYQKAWCDGISADGQTCYAYWWGLKAAREHLDALGAPYPDMPPFDESKYEPMPEVEINPPDEFSGEDEEEN